MRAALLFLAILPVSFGQDLAWRADAYLARLADRLRFQGAVLLARDGELLFERAYGVANIEHGVRNTTATKFRLYSVTKQFTATAILQLVERGLLQLDDPVCRFVDPCPPAWRPLTIHHLLSHTSGVLNITALRDYPTFKYLPASPESMIDKVAGRPLNFTPGSQYVYSNTNYIGLTEIIERVSGMEFETYLRTNILQPLGMDDTGYDKWSRVAPGRASGYLMVRGALVNAGFLNMTQPQGSGGLYSTVEDMWRWDRALYTDRVLSQEMIAKMFQPNLGGYAYGWRVDPFLGRRAVWHTGGGDGFSKIDVRLPDERLFVVVLANIENGSVFEIALMLAAMALGEA